MPAAARPIIHPRKRQETPKNTQVTTTKLKRLDSSGLADSIAKLIEKIRTKFVLRSGTRQVRRNLATERTISQAS